MSRLHDQVERWDAEFGCTIGDDIYVSHKLMFHYALLVNPNDWGYEDRYCYKTYDLLVKAVTEFKETGVLRYWHKHHSKDISIVGNYLYKSGDLQVKENAIGTVDWIV